MTTIVKPRDGKYVSEQVVAVNGELVRPGELLVDEAAAGRRVSELEGLKGRRYDPACGDLWRLRADAPHYGDINKDLQAAGLGLRLWVGLNPADAVQKAKDPNFPAHHNRVYRAQDFYHGGPGGLPEEIDPPLHGLPGWDGDLKVDIAVLDTGLPRGWDIHPGGLGKGVGVGMKTIIGSAQCDVVDENNDGIRDRQGGHGVFISGLIRRVAPELDIAMYRVLHATGEGDEALIIKTLAPLVNSTARVISLSFGTYLDPGQEPLLANTIRDLRKAGKVIVAAAGNEGRRKKFEGRKLFPACMPEVIAGGGYDSRAGRRRRWLGSNGADIYAPGRGLVSTFVTSLGHSGWARWSGTSFAAPVVAAKIAEVTAEASSPAEVTKKLDEWRATLDTTAWRPKPDATGPVRRFDPDVDLTTLD